MNAEGVLIVGGVVLLVAVGVFLLTRRRFLAGGSLTFLGALVAVVGGIHLMKPTPTYPPGSIVCTSGQPCIVPVLLTNCVPTPQFDPIIVLMGHGAVNIFWEAPTGSTFTDPDGIVFKDNNGDVDPRPGRTMAGARWQVADNPAHPIQIHYRIQVTSNGQTCTGPDPVIWNQ